MKSELPTTSKLLVAKDAAAAGFEIWEMTKQSKVTRYPIRQFSSFSFCLMISMNTNSLCDEDVVPSFLENLVYVGMIFPCFIITIYI